MSPPIRTPDGSEVNEIVLPNGATASEVIDPDGNVVFEAAPEIPDSALTQDLVAWYRFEDGDARDYTNDWDATFADTTAYDGTVNGATFQSSGGVIDFENGANSGAFDFDGTGDNIDISSLTPLSFTSGNTIMMWVKLDSDSEQILFGSEGRYRLSYEFKTLHYEFDIFNGSNWVAADTGVDFSANYVHLAGTAVEGGDMKVYLNGQLKDTVSISNFSRNPRNTKIGTDDRVNYNATDGTIDDTRFYNTVLSESQIDQIYQNTKL